MIYHQIFPAFFQNMNKFSSFYILGLLSPLSSLSEENSSSLQVGSFGVLVLVFLICVCPFSFNCVIQMRLSVSPSSEPASFWAVKMMNTLGQSLLKYQLSLTVMGRASESHWPPRRGSQATLLAAGQEPCSQSRETVMPGFPEQIVNSMQG